MSAPVAVALARIRLPLIGFAVVVALAAGFFVGVPWWLTLAVLLPIVVVATRIGTVRRAPVDVTVPVAGRWRAIRSPASKVPTHGTQAYGQTYALDLVHEPVDGSRPAYGWWPLLGDPARYPAFGEPVLAPSDGVVVRVKDGQRDHRCRSSWPAVAFMLLVEAPVRELLGPSRMIGNHVVIRLGDGVHALHAHLQGGSALVQPGDRVVAGQPIARCGNTGNSSEPHLHFQLMDHRNPVVAAGLPLRFDRFEIDGAARAGVPQADEAFVARPCARSGQGIWPARSAATVCNS